MDNSLLSWLEENLRSGDFAIVDKYLSETIINSLDTEDILIVLTFTFWGKDKLFNRETFLALAEPVLKLRLGEERTIKLLKNRR